MIPGHGSFLFLLKILQSTGMVHLVFPRQYCSKPIEMGECQRNRNRIIYKFMEGERDTCSTTSLLSNEVQVPVVKFPHAPKGSPKLAKSTLTITLWSGHFNWAFGFMSSTTACIRPLFRCHDFTCGGWYSVMKLHIVSLLTVKIVISSGFPPISSKITRRLLLGFKKDLGMWYLNQTCRLINR